MRQFVVVATVLGLTGCQFFSPTPRPTPGSGGDDVSGTGTTGTSGGNSGTKTPTPPPETPAPITASTGSDPATSSLSASKLPYQVARIPAALVDGLLVVPGGLFEPAVNATGGEITNQFATATLTGTTFGTWATASLPLRVCDQELAVDHKKRLLMIGGVTQPAVGGNTPIKDVYLGEIDSSKTIKWTKLGDSSSLPVKLSAFAMASSADGKVHYIAGGSGDESLQVSADAFIGRSADDESVTWTRIGAALPSERSGSAAVVTNSRFYVIGGDNRGERTKEVLAAQILSDGSLGTFSKVAELPAARAFMRAYVDNGNKIVVAGGSATSEVGAGTAQTVFVGKFDTSGTLTFSETASLSAAVQHYALAVSSNGAIMAGGSRAGESKQYIDQILQIPFGN